MEKYLDIKVEKDLDIEVENDLDIVKKDILDNNYNYAILNKLTETPSHNNFNICYLCVYNINTENNCYPYISYLFKKTFIQTLSLPYIFFNKNQKYDENENYKELILQSKILLMKYFINNLFINRKNIELEDITFKGFLEYDNDLYMFLNIPNYEQVYNCKEYFNWFLLIDEIINHKFVCNMNIENKMVNFFMSDNLLWYIYKIVI